MNNEKKFYNIGPRIWDVGAVSFDWGSAVWLEKYTTNSKPVKNGLAYHSFYWKLSILGNAIDEI